MSSASSTETFTPTASKRRPGKPSRWARTRCPPSSSTVGCSSSARSPRRSSSRSSRGSSTQHERPRRSPKYGPCACSPRTRLNVDFVDELDGVIGWIDESRLRRASHALAAAGRVWVFDPIAGDGVEERIRSLGEPAAVVQLLDRHDRDAAPLARRLGVPHEVVPTELPDSPFHLLRVTRSRFWSEAALWWPERRILVCADAVGTI